MSGALKQFGNLWGVIGIIPLSKTTFQHSEKRGNRAGHGCQSFTLDTLGGDIQGGINSLISFKLSTITHKALHRMLCFYSFFFFFLLPGNSGALFTSEGTSSTTTITKNEILQLSLPTSMESVQL